MDTQVEVFLKQLHGNGAVVNTAIVMVTAEIKQNHDSSLLPSNSGPILITINWAKSLRTMMNYDIRVKGFSTILKSVNHSLCMMLN